MPAGPSNPAPPECPSANSRAPAPHLPADALRTGNASGRRGVGIVVDPRRLGEEWILRTATQPGWRLAFACSTIEDALAAMQRHAPALLLVDLALADGSALELLREAGRHWPECVAVALSGDAALSMATARALHALPQHAPEAALRPATVGPGVLSSWGRGL